MTTGICDFKDGCQAPVLKCSICAPEELRGDRHHNFLFLQGDPTWTDEAFREMVHEQKGVWIPDEDMYTARINDVYVNDNPEKNRPYINKLLAKHGLLDLESINE